MRISFKLTMRTIKSFFGRYMALLLIVTLSVGFFAGLKVTKDAMWNACEKYLAEQEMHDYRIFSTIGFSEEDVNAFSEIDGIKAAEGGVAIDAIVSHNSTVSSFKLLSIPAHINLPSLVSGRMPTAMDECLADAEIFHESDIGTVIRITNENDKTVTAQLVGKEYTIVGLADSPLFLNDDCGSAGIGSGTLDGFFYLPEDAFESSAYTEINLSLRTSADIYSQEYDGLIESYKAEITQTANDRTAMRYEDILASLNIPKEYAEQAGIEEPSVYVLTRSENTGYISFKNDTSIVSGVANIFPLFFILIAMLVCMTTMTRMVDEERTQIGVLKAMGFGNGAIIAKYLLYAGSATLIGWAAGFFLGTWGLPQVFWYAYSSLYDFTSLSYLFSPYLAAVTLIVSLIGILGSAYLSCRKELLQNPARLIRPRSSKKGKRILLERFAPFWRRLTFLHKITLRNMFRYKKRMIMMLVGISCCAALVTAAFGVRDSMVGVGSLQFETVQKYDMEVSFKNSTAQDVAEKLNDMEGVDNFFLCSQSRVDVYAKDGSSSANLLGFDNWDGLSDFWTFESENIPLPLPNTGEALISTRTAERLSLTVGDTAEIQNTDLQSITVTISGIFDNYVDNFAIVSADTLNAGYGEWTANCALIQAPDAEANELSGTLTEIPEITGVTQLQKTRVSVDSALSCLNYIIWLIVLFSGALAFIVIFNLTNINLAERSREIATVEVLGFYPKETASYVLRENLILSVIAGVVGLPLGTLFHRIVMHMIVIDSMAFDIHITPVSYVLALICTVVFAFIVNRFMKQQIGKIQMAESLKAVE